MTITINETLLAIAEALRQHATPNADTLRLQEAITKAQQELIELPDRLEATVSKAIVEASSEVAATIEGITHGLIDEFADVLGDLHSVLDIDLVTGGQS